MNTHDNRSATPDYPDATPVEQHLVVDKTDWVPGKHPDQHRRWDGQTAYRERFFRCILCGEERTSKADFPPECAEHQRMREANPSESEEGEAVATTDG